MRLMSGREKLMQIDLSNRECAKTIGKYSFCRTGEFSEEKNSWRYDEEGNWRNKNSTLQTGLYGTSFISAWRIHMWQNIKVHYTGIIPRAKLSGADKRSALEILGGVKYFVTQKKGKGPGAYQEKEKLCSRRKRIYYMGKWKETTVCFA